MPNQSHSLEVVNLFPVVVVGDKAEETPGPVRQQQHRTQQNKHACIHSCVVAKNLFESDTSASMILLPHPIGTNACVVKRKRVRASTSEEIVMHIRRRLRTVAVFSAPQHRFTHNFSTNGCSG